MSSQKENMAQKALLVILKYYNIIAPTVQNATNPHLLQECDSNIPQGIPALLAYSQVPGNNNSPDKPMVMAFLEHHVRNLPKLRLVALACGLLYLSRPMIGPVLSSAWEETSQVMDELLTWHPLPNFKTKAKYKLQLEPKRELEPNPNLNTNAEPELESKTVTMTAAELRELISFADAVEVRLDEAKTLQEDLLTANCELEDDVERLEDDIKRLKKQVKDDAAHSEARIRALNDQIETQEDGRQTVWNDRERYRLGGKDLKTMLDALQAEFNELEDDRDEWSEMAVELAMELQGELDDMTSERDDLQAHVSQLETEKQDLESSLAQKLADQKASDERQAELEKSAAEAAKALSDAVATQQKQDTRIEELEAKKKKEVADAMNALTTFKAQVQADQYEDLGKKMRAAVDEEKRKTELQDLNKAYEYLKIDNEALRSAERDHEEAVEEYQDTCEDLEQEVRKQKKDLQVAEGEMAGLRAEIAALKDRLEAQSTGAKDGSRQDEDEHDSSNGNAGKADQGGDDDDDTADDDADGADDTVTDDNGAQGDKGVTDTPPSAAESGYPSLTPSDGGQSQSPTPHTPQSSTSSGSAPATGSAVGAITAQPIAVEDTPDIDPQRETIKGSEVGALPGQPDAQTDLTAKNKDETDKAQVERLQVQLNVEQANYNFVFKKKEVFRHGGKQLKKNLEALQAEYNVLEDGRDTWKETCEALEQQADVRAVRALHDQIASDKVDHERRIEALETQLGFEKTNREDAQKVARELRETSKKLRNELKEANMKHESLQIAYNELDNMHGAEERANEDKDEEITDLRTELDRVEANLSALNERYIELNAERIGAAETVAVAEEEESRPNGEAIFQKPEGSRTISAEGAPLRRIQSAPLWLPPPHHGDTFDPLYDVSDYGDDDRDHKDGDEDRGEDPGEHGDKHDSGNDNGNGPDEDDKRDDDDQDNGRDGGTEKVTADAYQTRKDYVADSPALSEDTPSLADPQTLEPSPQRASFRLNGSASKFVPSVRPKRPAPPILPHHQAYIASQHGVNSSDSESSSASPLHNFRTYSAAKSGTLSPEATVQGSVHNQQPFPGVYDSTLPHHDELTEHIPAPKAAGPEDAKNAHIQKLNEQVKRLEWMKKSGKPDLVEDREGVAGPDDVLDGMYDRQVTRFLECTPIRCARGSMWGALNDIPNPLENMSIPSTPSSSRLGSSQMNSNGEEGTAETSVKGARGKEKYGEDLADGLATAPELPVEEDVPTSSSGTPAGDEECENDGEWSDIQEEDHEEIDDGMPMLGNYKVTRGQTNEQENDNGPILGNHNVTQGPKPTRDNSKNPMLGKYEVTRAQVPPSSEPGAPKAEEESGADGGWTNVEDEGDDEDQSDDKDVVTSPLPLPQAQPSAQESSPLAAHATAASSPAAQGHTSDEPNAEAARDAQPAKRRLSNHFPGSENATKTHDEDVGDAFVNYVRQHGAKKLEESMWADKLDADTTPRVRLPTPRWCGIDNPDQTPRVRLPRPPKASQAQPPPVIPATCTSTQGELEDGPNPEAAPFDTREVRAFASPSKPAYRGSPLRNAIGAPPFKKNYGGMQHRNGATPAGVVGGSDSWPTRGSGRGGRGARGGHGGRGAHRVQGAAALNLTANGPRAEPMTPAARNGSQSPGFSVRGCGGGRAGRGGHQAGRQQQGPVRGSTPNAAATTTTNINKKQTPSAHRGGLGGPVTPTPQPGPARGARFANTANSSFQRWQDRMAKKQQE